MQRPTKKADAVSGAAALHEARASARPSTVAANSELAHRILAAGSEGQGYATAAGATTVPFSGAPQPVAQLFRERGLSAAGVTDRLRAMAERTLLRAPRPDAP